MQAVKAALVPKLIGWFNQVLPEQPRQADQ